MNLSLKNLISALFLIALAIIFVFFVAIKTKNEKKIEYVPSKIEVEIDVFSGLPNPICQLTEKEVRKIFGKINSLKRIQKTYPKNDLGYRGMILIINQDSRINVSNGFIADDKNRFFYLDENQEVEKLIFAYVSRCVDDDLKKEISRNISP